jgi:2-methylcitrate dehydratase PrpD
MTLVQEIITENDLKSEEVDAVHVGAWDFLLTPMWTDFPYIPTEYDAQFSITHAIAALVQGWDMGPEWQGRAVRNPELDALAKKVVITANPRFADDCVVTPEGFRGMPTVVSVHARGREFCREGSTALGDGFEPRYRFDLAAIKQKYLAYAKCSLSEEQVESTFANITSLEDLPDVKFALTT